MRHKWQDDCIKMDLTKTGKTQSCSGLCDDGDEMLTEENFLTR
jgi:hypothetical protein